MEMTTDNKESPTRQASAAGIPPRSLNVGPIYEKRNHETPEMRHHEQ
jgi:hypothetical protein